MCVFFKNFVSSFKMYPKHKIVNHLYTYIYRPRERDRDRQTGGERDRKRERGGAERFVGSTRYSQRM